MSKIIIVDDDPSNVSLLEIFLGLEGFTVASGSDIEKAKAVTDENTDAFLIDYHLARGASGLDLLHDIRQGKTLAGRDAVIIIASGDHRREKEALEAGADKFLLKPYPPDQLSRSLNQLLASREQDGS